MFVIRVRGWLTASDEHSRAAHAQKERVRAEVLAVEEQSRNHDGPVSHEPL